MKRYCAVEKTVQARCFILSMQQGGRSWTIPERAYFVRESCFWPFAFHLGQVNHEEGQVAEIEAKLMV